LEVHQFGLNDIWRPETPTERKRITMLSAEILKVLVCPETHLELSLADADLLGRLNGAISAGRLTNKAGQPVKNKLDAALVRTDGAVAYAVVDEIPMMLIDEGIPLDQPALKS
jgi:uncharacterized protein YbaR (Trm112 family)